MLLARALCKSGDEEEFVCGDTTVWYRPVLNAQVSLLVQREEMNLFLLAKQLGVLPTDIRTALDFVVVGDKVFNEAILERNICLRAEEMGLHEIAIQVGIDAAFVQRVLAKHGIHALESIINSVKPSLDIAANKLKTAGICTVQEFDAMKEYKGSDDVVMRLTTVCCTRAYVEVLLSRMECDVNDLGYAVITNELENGDDVKALMKLYPEYMFVPPCYVFPSAVQSTEHIGNDDAKQALAKHLNPKPIATPIVRYKPTTKQEIERDIVAEKWPQLLLLVNGAQTVFKKRYGEFASLTILPQLQQDIVTELYALLRFQLQLRPTEPIPSEHEFQKLVRFESLSLDKFMLAVQQVASQYFTLACLLSMDKKLEKKMIAEFKQEWLKQAGDVILISTVQLAVLHLYKCVVVFDPSKADLVWDWIISTSDIVLPESFVHWWTNGKHGSVDMEAVAKASVKRKRDGGA